MAGAQVAVELMLAGDQLQALASYVLDVGQRKKTIVYKRAFT